MTFFYRKLKSALCFFLYGKMLIIRVQETDICVDKYCAKITEQSDLGLHVLLLIFSARFSEPLIMK